MIYVLADGDDPILHNKVERVDPDLDRLGFSRMMVDNMIGHRGIGLSANQIGKSVRAFAIMLDNQPVVCYNPRIAKRSKDKTVLTEGCLSFPDTMVNVERPSAVGVIYENERKVTVKVSLFGLEAKCFQHELDHLNGITMMDIGVPLE